MPTPPAAWENATPVFGIRYPKPTAPAKYLADMFQHTGADVEAALIADQNVPPGLVYKTGTKAQRLAAPPAKDQVWVETDTGDQYIGTGSAWIGLGAVPFRQAAGTVAGVGTIANGAGVSVPVTFPAGRFTAPPIVTLTSNISSRVTLSTNVITATGFTARLDNWSPGAAATNGFDWAAIQMLSGSGAG